MPYYTEEQRRRGQLTRERNARLKKLSEAPEDFYDIWGYRVPKVTKKPSPLDYGVDEGTKSQLDEMDEKYVSNKKQARKNNVVFLVFTTVAVSFLYIIYGGEIDVLMNVLALPVFLGWYPLMIYLSSDIKPPQTHKHIQFDKYSSQLKYYEYWQRRIDKNHWNRMSGHRFEHEVANLFREIKFDAQVTKRSGDGGVDVVLSKGNRKIAVQCKRYNKPVGPHVIRDLLGTMHHLGYSEGAIVTTTGFTSGVKEFADQNNRIYLIDLNDILRSVNKPSYLLNKINY